MSHRPEKGCINSLVRNMHSLASSPACVASRMSSGTPHECFQLLVQLEHYEDQLQHGVAEDIMLEILDHMHDSGSLFPSSHHSSTAYAALSKQHALMPSKQLHLPASTAVNQPDFADAGDSSDTSSGTANSQWMLCLRKLLQIAIPNHALIQELVMVLQTEIACGRAKKQELLAALLLTLPKATSPPPHHWRSDTQVWHETLRQGLIPVETDLMLIATSANAEDSTAGVGSQGIQRQNVEQQLAIHAMAAVCKSYSVQDLRVLLQSASQAFPGLSVELPHLAMNLLGFASNEANLTNTHEAVLAATGPQQLHGCGHADLPGIVTLLPAGALLSSSEICTHTGATNTDVVPKTASLHPLAILSDARPCDDGNVTAVPSPHNRQKRLKVAYESPWQPCLDKPGLASPQKAVDSCQKPHLRSALKRVQVAADGTPMQMVTHATDSHVKPWIEAAVKLAMAVSFAGCRDMCINLIRKLIEEVSTGGSTKQRSAYWLALSTILEHTTTSCALQEANSHNDVLAHLQSRTCDGTAVCEILLDSWAIVPSLIDSIVQEIPLLMKEAPEQSAQRLLNMLSPLLPYSTDLAAAFLQAAADLATLEPVGSPAEGMRPSDNDQLTQSQMPIHMLGFVSKQTPRSVSFCGDRLPTAMTHTSMQTINANKGASGNNANMLALLQLAGTPSTPSGALLKAVRLQDLHDQPAVGSRHTHEFSRQCAAMQSPTSTCMTGSTMACPPSVGCDSLFSLGSTYGQDPMTHSLLHTPVVKQPSLQLASGKVAAEVGRKLAGQLYCSVMMGCSADDFCNLQAGMQEDARSVLTGLLGTPEQPHLHAAQHCQVFIDCLAQSHSGSHTSPVYNGPNEQSQFANAPGHTQSGIIQHGTQASTTVNTGLISCLQNHAASMLAALLLPQSSTVQHDWVQADFLRLLLSGDQQAHLPDTSTQLGPSDRVALALTIAKMMMESMKVWDPAAASLPSGQRQVSMDQRQQHYQTAVQTFIHPQCNPIPLEKCNRDTAACVAAMLLAALCMHIQKESNTARKESQQRLLASACVRVQQHVLSAMLDMLLQSHQHVQHLVHDAVVLQLKEVACLQADDHCSEQKETSVQQQPWSSQQQLTARIPGAEHQSWARHCLQILDGSQAHGYGDNGVEALKKPSHCIARLTVLILHTHAVAPMRQSMPAERLENLSNAEPLQVFLKTNRLQQLQQHGIGPAKEQLAFGTACARQQADNTHGFYMQRQSASNSTHTNSRLPAGLDTQSDEQCKNGFLPANLEPITRLEPWVLQLSTTALLVDVVARHATSCMEAGQIQQDGRAGKIACISAGQVCDGGVASILPPKQELVAYCLAYARSSIKASVAKPTLPASMPGTAGNARQQAVLSLGNTAVQMLRDVGTDLHNACGMQSCGNTATTKKQRVQLTYTNSQLPNNGLIPPIVKILWSAMNAPAPDNLVTRQLSSSATSFAAALNLLSAILSQLPASNTQTACLPTRDGVRVSADMQHDMQEMEPSCKHLSLVGLCEDLVPARMRDAAAKAALFVLQPGHKKSTWNEVGKEAARQPLLGTSLALLLRVYTSLPVLQQAAQTLQRKERAASSTEQIKPKSTKKAQAASVAMQQQHDVEVACAKHAIAIANDLLSALLLLASALIDVVCSNTSVTDANHNDSHLPTTNPATSMTIGPSSPSLHACATKDQRDSVFSPQQPQSTADLPVRHEERKAVSSLGSLCCSLACQLLTGEGALPDVLAPTQGLLGPLLRIACSTSLRSEGTTATATPSISAAAAMMSGPQQRTVPAMQNNRTSKGNEVESALGSAETAVMCARLVTQILIGQLATAQTRPASGPAPRHQLRDNDMEQPSMGMRVLWPELLTQRIKFVQPVSRRSPPESSPFHLTNLLSASRNRKRTEAPQDVAQKLQRKLGYAAWAQLRGGLSVQLAANVMMRLSGCLWRDVRQHVHTVRDLQQATEAALTVEARGDQVGSTQPSTCGGQQAHEPADTPQQELITGRDVKVEGCMEPEVLLLVCASAVNAAVWLASLAQNGPAASTNFSQRLQLWQQALSSFYHVIAVCSQATSELALFIATHQPQQRQGVETTPAADSTAQGKAASKHAGSNKPNIDGNKADVSVSVVQQEGRKVPKGSQLKHICTLISFGMHVSTLAHALSDSIHQSIEALDSNMPDIAGSKQQPKAQQLSKRSISRQLRLLQRATNTLDMHCNALLGALAGTASSTANDAGMAEDAQIPNLRQTVHSLLLLSMERDSTSSKNLPAAAGNCRQNGMHASNSTAQHEDVCNMLDDRVVGYANAVRASGSRHTTPHQQTYSTPAPDIEGDPLDLLKDFFFDLDDDEYDSLSSISEASSGEEPTERACPVGRQVLHAATALLTASCQEPSLTTTKEAEKPAHEIVTERPQQATAGVRRSPRKHPTKQAVPLISDDDDDDDEAEEVEEEEEAASIHKEQLPIQASKSEAWLNRERIGVKQTARCTRSRQSLQGVTLKEVMFSGMTPTKHHPAVQTKELSRPARNSSPMEAPLDTQPVITRTKGSIKHATLGSPRRLQPMGATRETALVQHAAKHIQPASPAAAAEFLSNSRRGGSLARVAAAVGKAAAKAKPPLLGLCKEHQPLLPAYDATQPNNRLSRKNKQASNAETAKVQVPGTPVPVRGKSTQLTMLISQDQLLDRCKKQAASTANVVTPVIRACVQSKLTDANKEIQLVAERRNKRRSLDQSPSQHDEAACMNLCSPHKRRSATNNNAQDGIPAWLSPTYQAAQQVHSPPQSKFHIAAMSTRQQRDKHGQEATEECHDGIFNNKQDAIIRKHPQTKQPKDRVGEHRHNNKKQREASTVPNRIGKQGIVHIRPTAHRGSIKKATVGRLLKGNAEVGAAKRSMSYIEACFSQGTRRKVLKKGKSQRRTLQHAHGDTDTCSSADMEHDSDDDDDFSDLNDFIVCRPDTDYQEVFRKRQQARAKQLLLQTRVTNDTGIDTQLAG